MATRNIAYRVDGMKLFIEIDLSADLGVSKSGLSSLIATAGNIPLVGAKGIRLTLSLYRPRSKRDLLTQADEVAQVEEVV